jgi:hypothetical protein
VNPRAQTATGDTMLALAVAASGAALMGLILVTASAAPNMKARLEALDVRTERIQALSRQAPADAMGPPDSLCHQDPAEAAKREHDAVAVLGAQANVTLDAVDARPDLSGDTQAGLTPIRLRVSATGSYESIMALLAALSRQRPLVYVDSLDLTPKVSNVTAVISGRSFCAV